MTLAPLLNAPLVIQLHTFAALAIIPVVFAQFIRPKFGISHRTLGWTFVVLMVIVATTSFLIHRIQFWGPFSPIHILSIVSLVCMAIAIRARRRGDIATHKYNMIGVAAGWAGAGLFTLLPTRILGRVVFGG